MTVHETSLGPIWQVGGKSYAVHWLAHEPGAANIGLLAMEEAADLGAAQAAANRAGMPAQNMVAGDTDGHIGWTIAGPLPARTATPERPFRSPPPTAGRPGMACVRLLNIRA